MSDLKSLLQGWPALSRHLDEALELDAGERLAWIDALTAPPDIKRALHQLLAAGEPSPGEPIDAPPRLPDGFEGEAAEAPAWRVGLMAGARVGTYRLLREIGRGGMGVVWLAERDDGVLNRRVALKLPHIEWSADLDDRLQRERDILASLAHENIARIHDAGFDGQGRPFLALEYIEGQPIDLYARDQRLPTGERLRLLLQVARAVAHAHSRLVVHRDLKPANILVTAAGEVRLLDFGIAQLLDGGRVIESALTRRAGPALTLDYASPEQLLGGAIGTASDVYSLAVVAYEVLTDEKPYRLRRPTAASLEEAIIALDVRPASLAAADPAARRALRGDVDAILNKAMKKDPQERYFSVDAFAQDIERHLARLPVTARPDTVAYRARRFLARNALGVTAAAAVIVALLTGTAVAWWEAGAARSEALHAEQVKRFALSIVNGADSESGANRATTAVELLLAARNRVEQELGDSPATAVELMTAVGTGLQSQGRVQEALALLAAARDRATRTLRPAHPLTLGATIAYGLALVGADRPKEAIAVLAPAAAEAARQGNAHARIEALFDLSTAQLAAAQGAEGVESARAAVAALQASGKNALPLDALNAWGQLANALNATQQPGLTDAASHAVAVARGLYGEQVTGNVLGMRLLLARGFSADGRDAESLAELEAVYADALRLFGPDQPRLEPIANFLGLARADAGDLDGAIAAFRAALHVGELLQTGTGGNRGIDHFTLGRALAAKRLDEEALGHLQESVRLLTEAVGPATPQTLRSRSVQGAVLTRLGRLAEAERSFAGLDVAAWPPAEKAQNGGRLAVLRSLQGRPAEAIALARSARDALAAHPSKVVRATAESVLGRVLLAAGRPEDALPPLRAASRLFAERQPVRTPDRADVDAALATATLAMANPAAPGSR
ncbi:MAG: serine/threonine protein kinase [Pseudomonadota bacterium]|nr:serine/threonine protein kinase [Pseudomonadota bacterium]